MFPKKIKSGESLVEVIVAIFVIAIGSAVATSLVVSALQSNNFSRDNLIALNLAVEGLEVMRGIRDANWLKFSYNKEGCWNMRPEVEECNPGVKTIADGNYTVDLDLTPNKYSWSLPATPIATALDLDGAIDNSPYQLVYYDINILDGAKDHDVLATNVVPPKGTESGTSPYYRMVNVKNVSLEEMDVTSVVQWRSQGVKHEIALSTKLTNYQKVKLK